LIELISVAWIAIDVHTPPQFHCTCISFLSKGALRIMHLNAQRSMTKESDVCTFSPHNHRSHHQTTPKQHSYSASDLSFLLSFSLYYDCATKLSPQDGIASKIAFPNPNIRCCMINTGHALCQNIELILY